jgi:superfamily II DNA or RNA helicase
MSGEQSPILTPKYSEMLEEHLHDFSSRNIADGQFLYQSGAVGSPTWNESENEIRSDVFDLKKYTVTINVDDFLALGECTCKHRVDCRHVAAVIFKTREMSRAQTKAPHSTNKLPPASEGSLLELISLKTGKTLPKNALRFLKSADSWWKTKKRKIVFNDFNSALGLSSIWRYDELVVYPEEYPPQSASEFLAYLAELARNVDLEMPYPINDMVDQELKARLMAQWDRLKETHRWLESLRSWKDAEDSVAVIPPELRFKLTENGTLIEIRHPGELEFCPLIQKKLKSLVVRNGYGEPPFELSPGSHIVLRSLVDKYGEIHGVQVTEMSASFTKSLSQLASSEEMFHAHVVGRDGGRVEFSNQRLVWDLSSPKGSDDCYELTLRAESGEIPPSPLAVLPGKPLRYITCDRVYSLDYWPFGNTAVSWPQRIPVKALESREGINALAKLKLPPPKHLAEKVQIIAGDIVVRCRVFQYESVASDYLQISAKTTFSDYEAPLLWDGENWVNTRSSFIKKIPSPDTFIQIEKFAMPATTAWLRQMTKKSAAFDYSEIWLEQRIQGKEWPEHFISWLDQRPEGCVVELDSDLASLRDGSVAGFVQLHIEDSSAEIDWFDLSVALSVDDTTLTQEEINLLLKAKGKWVRIKGKGWRKLDFQLSEEQIKELADLGLAVDDFSHEKQRLHALQLGSLTKKNTSLLGADRVMQIQRRIEDIQTRVTPPAPDAITATLRPYQLEGFHFLAYLTANSFGGVLADDMGLGKTLQTLAWIAWLRKDKNITEPMLVVCPKSVQDNWQAECLKFFPDLNVEVWSRSNADSKKVKTEADLLVINYAQLRNNEELLRSSKWGAVILDEAQAIKNPSSQNAKAACSLAARHRLALTGTPIENRLLDLWSIFAFAMPGVLGKRASFVKNFDGKEDLFARRRLSARTRPFLLRRTKNEVARDLPDRVEEDIIVEFDGTQSTLYNAELKRARAQLLKVQTNKQLDKLRFNILTSLLRLRQICCHPRLLGLESSSKKTKQATAEESAKVSALMELLEPLMEEGQKVLVFSQFLEMLEIIREEITQREWPSFMLTGQTEDRGKLVDSFQKHEGAGIFLISLKAGGAGLNLTAASYVVLFDPWWNPAVEAQAIDRTHRIGQKQTVFAYRLLIKNTIEEKIRTLQKHKGNIANDILGEENFAKALTIADFQFLLGDEMDE